MGIIHMAKYDSKEFNFDDIQDEDYAGELYRQEMKDLRIEKINQRVTIPERYRAGQRSRFWYLPNSAN